MHRDKGSQSPYRPDLCKLAVLGSDRKRRDLLRPSGARKASPRYRDKILASRVDHRAISAFLRIWSHDDRRLFFPVTRILQRQWADH